MKEKTIMLQEMFKIILKNLKRNIRGVITILVILFMTTNLDMIAMFLILCGAKTTEK